MKPRILILSIVINLLLGIVLIASGRRTEQGRVSSMPSNSVPPALKPMPVVSHQTNTMTNTAAFNWSQIESSDYRAYIANLRAIGCPERTIADIIEADVNELYAARIRELVDSVSGQFWYYTVNHELFEGVATEKLKKLEEIAKERKELLASLLESPRAVKEHKARLQAEAQTISQLKYEFLSPEKVAALREIADRFDAEQTSFFADHPNLDGRERGEAERDFKSKKEKAIENLLSAEEYAEYKLRNDSAADLRFQLSDMKLNEAEIRALVQAKTEPQSDATIQQMLGPERYAEFQRAQDNNYQFMLRMAERFNLPDETPGRIYEMRREAETQARQIREDKTRDAEERIAILKAMQAETERSLSEVLGAKAFRAYQRNSDDWLSNLAQNVK